VRSPTVSVILCTFNRRSQVGHAIRSVLTQSFADFELIVVDDGSTDRTAEVVLPLARRDARIIYMRHANRGLAAARNAGIHVSRGEWVTFIDSDDSYAPDHLKVRMALVAEGKLDAVFGGARLVGPRQLHYVADVDRPGHKIHLARCHIGGTLFVRRTVLIDLGGFHELAYSEDHELMARIERRYRVGVCTRATYLYRLGGNDRLGALYLRGGARAIEGFRATSLE
jgi:glycosyltransferase involved in cell wall biosynthesis